MRLTKLVTLVAAALALLALPAIAQAKDRDRDGLPDRWEASHHLSTHSKSANGDADRDHVDNGNEYRERTNPRDRDTDNDSRPDGREDRDRDHLSNAGEDVSDNDPVDRDTDNDGTLDGNEQAGVVSSYKDGVLTIDLSNGGSVTGRVTDETRVECQGEAASDGDGRPVLSQEGGPQHGGPPPPPRFGEEGQGGHELDQQGGAGPREEGGRHCDGRGHSVNARSCPAGTLREGARIHAAKLDVGPDGAVWEEIDVIS